MKDIYYIVLTFFLLFPDILFCQSASDDRTESLGNVAVNDSVSVNINLRYSNNIPYEYFAKVRTPVCEDNLCYEIRIEIYWDLMAQYKKYQLLNGEPLTKFDHIKFEKNDYDKLERILSNKQSNLKYLSHSDLLDTKKEIHSNVVVDAVTSATKSSLKNDVVEGAAYSTYVLWHLVNGDVADFIREQTAKKADESLIRTLLTSDNYNYQYYGLEKVSNSNSDLYVEDIIGLLSRGIDFIPFFAIDKISEKALNGPQYQLLIIQQISRVSPEMQSIIINRVSKSPLTPEVLKQIVNLLPVLEKAQVTEALELLRPYASQLDEPSKKIYQNFNRI